LEVVKLSITTPWSNGPIEGHINRLKALKRCTDGLEGWIETLPAILAI
jgi:transposase